MVIIREPPLLIVRVGLLTESSLKIILLPLSWTVQPSIVRSFAKTNSCWVKTNSCVPGVWPVRKVLLVNIHAQSMPASSRVTGGAVSLMSANEPMVYVPKVPGGVCNAPSTN